MDVDYWKRSHVPAFGNWDYANDLPITQYFESARQAGLLRYSACERDLYVVSDFYGNDDLKKPPKTAVSRRKTKEVEKRYTQHDKEPKKQGRVCDVTGPPSKDQEAYVHRHQPPPPRAPKAVDEDLYKIPPELLRSYPRKKKMFGFFSRCLVPTCVV
ncbi:PREDICTED: uncharacterized protein LOC104587988 [Nelumbo nucifera]|uniref:RPM1-interacting protein 4-like n=2 Tax=Nelumbo nucifera TaxID=4432 RepID=A0A822XRK0_NELNU|nr:PREDICTED: uncharacterized protein LOC104587988 [Nelumbo nucifera]DAD24224.1 TPA_asm: hypothetical protein HUJ06_025687 [Nelumbo nucifera]